MTLFVVAVFSLAFLSFLFDNLPIDRPTVTREWATRKGTFEVYAKLFTALDASIEPLFNWQKCFQNFYISGSFLVVFLCHGRAKICIKVSYDEILTLYGKL